MELESGTNWTLAVVPKMVTSNHEQRKLLSGGSPSLLQRAEEVSDPDKKRGWLSKATEYEELAKVLEEGQERKD